MESSIAVFLKRQLACELLPTCGLGATLTSARPSRSLGAMVPRASHSAGCPEGMPLITPLRHYHRPRRTCLSKHTQVAR